MRPGTHAAMLRPFGLMAVFVVTRLDACARRPARLVLQLQASLLSGGLPVTP
jgi:hypothetical protein